MTITTRIFALMASALMMSFVAITTADAGYRGGRMGGGFHHGGFHGGGFRGAAFHRGGFHGARMHYGGFHRMAPRMMAPRMVYRPSFVHRGFNGGGYRFAHAHSRAHVARGFGRPIHFAHGPRPHMRAHIGYGRPAMMRSYAHAPRIAPMRPAMVHRMASPHRFAGGFRPRMGMGMGHYARRH